MKIDEKTTPADLVARLDRVWELSGAKLDALNGRWKPEDGSPVFTIDGRYAARGWTEWTQGFQFGSSALQYDATGDERHLHDAVRNTTRFMARHVVHFGVHDHGFNNVSTYGALWRLAREERLPASVDADGLRRFCRLALQCSGAVQARRWTPTADGAGFIHSFNGPQSLFADTMRSLRSLALAHVLGQTLDGEQDLRTSLLERLILHARATAKYNVYYGEGRDVYDVRGRVAHESLFNPSNGGYRCPSTQQGYSPFTTWTRGLAWVLLGYAEQLEFWDALDPSREPLKVTLGARVAEEWLRAARATADFYIDNTDAGGIPYWDTGAPGLHKLGDWRSRAADPFHPAEPVDSSAAAIAAQGLLRLGAYLKATDPSAAGRYYAAGLTVAARLFDEPYLSTSDGHEGLLLHSVYHRPNGWDHVPEGLSTPAGESSLWGDYHLRELALYIGRLEFGPTYYTFFGPTSGMYDQ
ncbi:MAG: glycosyl hydrolase [Planctomycetia bacterium]